MPDLIRRVRRTAAALQGLRMEQPLAALRARQPSFSGRKVRSELSPTDA